MAEPTLSVDYAKLRTRIADFLGLGRVVASWSADDSARIAECIEGGMNRFLNPPPIQGYPAAYTWSFLNISTTLNLIAGTEEYTLPDSFGRLTSRFQFSDQKGTLRMKFVPKTVYDETRDMLSSTQTRPIMFCIIPQAVAAGVGQRFKAAFYPLPDAAYTLRYSYRALSDALAATGYLPGTAAHGETIALACLAWADLHRNGRIGEMESAFMQALAGSINNDLALNAEYDWLGSAMEPESEAETIHSQDWFAKYHGGPVTP